MATVVNVPRDERFGELGQSLGSFVEQLGKAQAIKQKLDRRKQQLDEVFQMLGDPNNDVSRAGVVSTLKDYDVSEQVSIADAVMRERDRKAAQEFTTSERIGTQSFQTSERRASQAFQTSERKDTQSFQTGERLGGQDFQVDLTLLGQQFTASENKKNRQTQKEIAGLPYDISEEQGNILANIPGVADDLKNGDLAAASGKIVNDQKLGANQKIDMLKILITNATSLESAKANADKSKTREHEATATAPDGRQIKFIVPAGQTVQQAADAAVARGDLPKGSKTGTYTEGRLDVQSVIENHRLDFNNPEDVAVANTFVRQEKTVRKLLDDHYGIIRDDQGLITRLLGDSRIMLLKNNLASQAVEQIMVDGRVTDAGKASEVAKKVAEQQFRDLEWVPDNIRNSGDARLVMDFAVKEKGFKEEDIRELARLINVPDNIINMYIDVKFNGLTPAEARKKAEGSNK